MRACTGAWCNVSSMLLCIRGAQMTQIALDDDGQGISARIGRDDGGRAHLRCRLSGRVVFGRMREWCGVRRRLRARGHRAREAPPVRSRTRAVGKVRAGRTSRVRCGRWRAECRRQRARCRGDRARCRGERVRRRGDSATVGGGRATIRGERATVRGERARGRGERVRGRGERARGMSGRTLALRDGARVGRSRAPRRCGYRAGSQWPLRTRPHTGEGLLEGPHHRLWREAGELDLVR